MKCDTGGSCEDEIRKYPSEPHMPDNQKFRIMMRDATK
jgi:hypothetical protein